MKPRYDENYSQDEAQVKITEPFAAIRSDGTSIDCIKGDPLTVLGLFPDYYCLEYRGEEVFADIETVDANTEPCDCVRCKQDLPT